MNDLLVGKGRRTPAAHGPTSTLRIPAARGRLASRGEPFRESAHCRGRGPVCAGTRRAGSLVDGRRESPLVHPGFLPPPADHRRGLGRGGLPTMRAARRPGRSGVTLIEVLLAMTLLSLLSVGMAVAMHVGLSALAKTDTKLMANRRVAGAQRILESELEGMIPGAGAVRPGNGRRPDRLFPGRSGGHAAGIDVFASRGWPAGGRRFSRSSSSRANREGSVWSSTRSPTAAL